MSDSIKTAKQVNQDKIDELSPMLKRLICLLGARLIATDGKTESLAIRVRDKEN